MKEKILCVDDEPKVIAALTRQLRDKYKVFSATGGPDGLKSVAKDGPFAVVLSDLRMPEMDGLSFLSRVRKRAPDTVLMLLTGQADLNTTITAINEGHIFRFLCKPCPPKTLMKAIATGIRQYQLQTSERILLEKTLYGSIKTLTDMLALVQPEAYGRATRLKRRAGEFMDFSGDEDRWGVEIAAMLEPIGWITIPPKTVGKLYRKETLTGQERTMVRQVPAVTDELLENIPRLEPVQKILAYRDKHFDGKGSPNDRVAGKQIPYGARILKIISDHDVLETSGHSSASALAIMRRRKGAYDPGLLESFQKMLGRDGGKQQVLETALSDVCLGMTFAENVVTRSGRLLIARGQEVTASTLGRIHNYVGATGIREPVWVLPAAGQESNGDDTITTKEHAGTEGRV